MRAARTPLRSHEDRLLVDAVRALPRIVVGEGPELGALFARAERHGLAGVLHDAYVAEGVRLPDAVERSVAAREAARECDHAAHLAMLGRIDGALERRGLLAVALKGALLGERLYPRPSARPTTDIDLLVREADLERATEALVELGYVPWDDPAEEHFRRAGHHTHLGHAQAAPVELHFHAYRGFGAVLRSEPLVARAVPWSDLSSVRVLADPDELAYLATHAAGHRFMRLGWLYDIALLLRKITPADVHSASERARDAGVSRPLALALERAAAHFGVRAEVRRAALANRRALLTAITEEPRWPLARAATRFAYGLALCEDLGAAGRYARDSFDYRVRRLVERAR